MAILAAWRGKKKECWRIKVTARAELSRLSGEVDRYSK